jgi:hypothetical protein
MKLPSDGRERATRLLRQGSGKPYAGFLLDGIASGMSEGVKPRGAKMGK